MLALLARREPATLPEINQPRDQSLVWKILDVHGKGCKQITNKFQTSDDLFIPFASKAEWESFLDYADSTANIDVDPCPIAYGTWNYSGSCSATCGGGTILQTRSCIYTPTGQSLDCSYCGGECSQTVACNTTACAEWDRSCSAPAWNPINNPATCGQSCTVTCTRDGIPVSGSQCTGPPPADYIASNSCTGCAPGSETTGSHTATCAQGGLSGSGTITLDDVRDCNGNIIPRQDTWTRVSGCCVPGLPSTQSQTINGINVAGCNAPPVSCWHSRQRAQRQMLAERRLSGSWSIWNDKGRMLRAPSGGLFSLLCSCPVHLRHRLQSASHDTCSLPDTVGVNCCTWQQCHRLRRCSEYHSLDLLPV